ncbi:TPA: LysE/ArgO family amino acid transporter [Vibrio cholerae]
MFSASTITGFTTSAGLLVCIGSQNAFVLKQGLLRNHLFTIATICIVSDIVLICAGVAGIDKLIKYWPDLIEIIRYGGAAFLALASFTSAKQAWYGNSLLLPAGDDHMQLKKVVLACLGFTWLNPYVYIDTVFMIGSLSIPYSGIDKWQFAIGASLASVLWFTAIIYGSRFLLPLFRSARAWRILDALIALTMVYLMLMLLKAPLV